MRGYGATVPAAKAMATPTAAPASRVSTAPRRSGKTKASAPASTRYCQGWVSSRVSVTADPKIAPIAAGPAPSRKALTRWLPRIRAKWRPPSRTNANDGANATTAAS